MAIPLVIPPDTSPVARSSLEGARHRSVTADRALRALLLEVFLDASLPTELSGWLRRLGLPADGPEEDRRTRLRAHADYLTVPAEDFPRATRRELDRLTTARLGALCGALGLAVAGPREALYRRALREVGYREGWLPPDARLAGDAVGRKDVEPFVRWHPVLVPVTLARELAISLSDELAEVFGTDRVHTHIPVSDDTGAPAIDVHVGDGVLGGVGIAIAARESGIPRAQLGRYRVRYGADLIVLLYPTRAADPDAPPTAADLRVAGVESIITIAS